MIYQIFYEKEQENELVNGFVPVYNSELKLGFENNVILGALDACQTFPEKYIGFFSWKAEKKIRKTQGNKDFKLHLGDIERKITGLPPGFISFMSSIRMTNVYHFFGVRNGNSFKPKTNEFAKKYVKFPGLNKCRHIPIFSNYWIINDPELADKYRQFLESAMLFVESDDYFLQPSGMYKKKLPKGNALGMNEYPIAPFWLEQMPNLFCDLFKVKIHDFHKL